MAHPASIISLSRRDSRPKLIRVAAYRYADGRGPIPAELVALSYIDRFGAQAVLGRPLGYGEIQRMLTAENIVKWYNERQKSGNFAQWAADNPDKDRALMEAMLLDGNNE